MRLNRKKVLLKALCLLLFPGALLSTTSAFAQSDEDTAKELTNFLKAARGVISDNQTLINDATKGDKGLTPAKVVENAKANYAKITGAEYPDGDAHKVLVASITSIMEQAQDVINEQGKGFKGFLPAVFGKQVADDFTKNMAGKMYLKLTAPKEYIRNRANRPDSWEEGVIESKFRASSWAKGEPFKEEADLKGQKAYRYIIPEYYGESCLSCHGDPKGEVDITGGKKEGGKLGELGGAISFAIYK
ncbi:MAG: DUF3365 domain-containing protein [Deltaproteobacteria bacterium]|nr:DUF3365 domain-containing protein [Deltaproteobacteria bacterium]